MIDAFVKFAAIALGVWLLTRRVTPRFAAAAHLLWLGVLAIGVLLIAAPAASPRLLIAPAGDVWLPQVLTAVGPLMAHARCVYWAGVGVMLIRLLAGVLEVRRWQQSSAALTGDDAQKVGAILGNVPVIVREGNVPGPMTVGFLKSVVILPLHWRTLSPETLAPILFHEAAHVRRRDCLCSLVCAFCETFAWFHPAVWLSGQRVRWFAELAADEGAARAIGVDRYASALLQIAQEYRHAFRGPYAVSVGARSWASGRIRALLDQAEGGPRGAALLVIAVAMVSSAAVASGFVKVMAEPVDAAPAYWDAIHQPRHSARHMH